MYVHSVYVDVAGGVKCTWSTLESFWILLTHATEFYPLDYFKKQLIMEGEIENFAPPRKNYLLRLSYGGVHSTVYIYVLRIYYYECTQFTLMWPWN